MKVLAFLPLRSLLLYSSVDGGFYRRYTKKVPVKVVVIVGIDMNHMTTKKDRSNILEHNTDIQQFHLNPPGIVYAFLRLVEVRNNERFRCGRRKGFNRKDERTRDNVVSKCPPVVLFLAQIHRSTVPRCDTDGFTDRLAFCMYISSTNI